MTTEITAYVIDNGMGVLVGRDLKYAICQTKPVSRADCVNLAGSGGNRISLEETLSDGQITLANGINTKSRKVVIPQFEFNSTVQVPVTAGSADAWVAVYDDTRLLLVSDQVTNMDYPLDATVVIAQIEYEWRQA